MTNEVFPIFDVKTRDGKRIIGLGTIDLFIKLLRCQHVFADGTFKCVPLIVKQLYTVHGKINGIVLRSFKIGHLSFCNLYWIMLHSFHLFIIHILLRYYISALEYSYGIQEK